MDKQNTDKAKELTYIDILEQYFGYSFEKAGIKENPNKYQEFLCPILEMELFLTHRNLYFYNHPLFQLIIKELNKTTNKQWSCNYGNISNEITHWSVGSNILRPKQTVAIFYNDVDDQTFTLHMSEHWHMGVATHNIPSPIAETNPGLSKEKIDFFDNLVRKVRKLDYMKWIVTENPILYFKTIVEYIVDYETLQDYYQIIADNDTYEFYTNDHNEDYLDIRHEELRPSEPKSFWRNGGWCYFTKATIRDAKEKLKEIKEMLAYLTKTTEVLETFKKNFKQNGPTIHDRYIGNPDKEKEFDKQLKAYCLQLTIEMNKGKNKHNLVKKQTEPELPLQEKLKNLKEKLLYKKRQRELEEMEDLPF